MKTVITALAAAIVLSACQADTPEAESTSTTPTKPPNIVLLLVDDMGYTDIGAFGSEVATPNLDALAFAGVRLTNFHSSPQCAPTRSMLLSGSDNHKAGMGSMFGSRMIVGEYGDQVGYEQQLHPRVATLPERLGDTGYHTYMSGKWHLGGALDQIPVERGFDRSFALIIGSSSHFGSPTINRATAFRADGELVEELPDGFYSSTTYTDKMIDFIDSNRGDGKPFFGYLALTAPHWPLQVPVEDLDRYKGRYDAGYDVLRAERVKRAEELGVVPEVDSDLFDVVGKTWDELTEDEQRYQARKMEIYAAMMEVMDDNIGRLVAHLKEIGEFENTYFFFMSDNGAEADREDLNPTFAGQIERSGYVDNSYENLGNPTSWVNLGPGFAQATTAPFRLFKGFPTEGGHKVTSFAYHPSLASGGIIDDQYLSLMDVMPTFLDIAGAEFDPTTVRGREVVPMDGRSFAAALGDADNPIYGPHDVIAYELHGQRYLQRGDWKILWEQQPINIYWDDEYPDRWNTWQLFNLANDPTEQHDLAVDEPELTAELVALWEQWADDNNVIKSITAQWPPPGPPQRPAAD
jgi:arylsulfatase